MITPDDPAVSLLPSCLPFRYESLFHYDVEYRRTPAGFTWSLIKRPAEPPIRREIKWRPFEAGAARAYLAALAEEAVGYCEFHLDSASSLIHVRHLIVSPTKKRCGVGTELLSAIETAARHYKARGVLVSTTTGNEPSIAFGLKRGYEPWGLREAEFTRNDEMRLWMGRAV